MSLIYRGHQYCAAERLATPEQPEYQDTVQEIAVAARRKAEGQCTLEFGEELKGACAVASDILVQMLEQQGYSAEHIVGTYWVEDPEEAYTDDYDEDVEDEDDILNHKLHHWVEVRTDNDVLIVDLTVDQFDDEVDDDPAGPIVIGPRDDFWRYEAGGHVGRYATTDQYQDVGFTETGRWGNQGSGCLFSTGERILLLRRSWDVEEPGTWGLPGGAIPEATAGQQDALQSALQETTEELGSVPPHQVIDQYVYQEPGFQYTTFVCLVDDSAAETNFRLNWENDDHSWFSRRELNGLDLHFGVRHLLEHIDPFVIR